MRAFALIGGFHTPVERECLRFLLRGRQPIINRLACGFQGMRQPKDWKQPLAAARLCFLPIPGI
jgi:hypothetical protein